MKAKTSTKDIDIVLSKEQTDKIIEKVHKTYKKNVEGFSQRFSFGYNVKFSISEFKNKVDYFLKLYEGSLKKIEKTKKIKFNNNTTIEIEEYAIIFRTTYDEAEEFYNKRIKYYIEKELEKEKTKIKRQIAQRERKKQLIIKTLKELGDDVYQIFEEIQTKN